MMTRIALMRFFYLPLLGSLLIFLPSCGLFRVGSGTGVNLNAAKKVTFCQLEEYNEQLIKTRLIYSGVEEYWSGSGFEKCDLNGQVDVNFDDYCANVE